MDAELIKKFEEQAQQLNEIHETVKKLKRYFLTTIVLTFLTFLLPILGLIISIPWLVKFFHALEITLKTIV